MKKTYDLMQALLPAISLVVILSLLAIHSNDLGGTWSGTALRHLLSYIVVFFGLIVVAKKVFKENDKIFSLSVGIVFFVFYCGVVEFFSATLFLISAFCLGEICIKFILKNEKREPCILPSTAVGAGVLILFFGVLILMPYNTRVLYCVYLAIPVAMYCLMFKRNDLLDLSAALSSAKRSIASSGSARFYTFLFLFLYIAAFCLFPTVTSDENAVHLSIWAQLTYHGFFSVDPLTQVWTAAPNTVSLIHGVISFVSGADAKSALNFYLLILTVCALFRLLSLVGVNTDDSFTLATLFISTPMVAMLMVGIQTDLFLGLLLIAVAISLVAIEKSFIAYALSALFCGAIALSSKLPGILIAGPALLVVFICMVRTKKYEQLSVSVWVKTCLLLALAAALALWPYAKAYYFTGNPVFPLYNAIFQSEYFDPINFKDGRWAHGASFTSFVGVFFESKRFMEATSNYIGGLQYFLLAPLSLLLIAARRDKKLLLVAFLAFSYLLPLFIALQYLRYFYAALPLVSILIAIFFLGEKIGRAAKKMLVAVIYILCALNFVFMPGASWLYVMSPLAFTKPKNVERLTTDLMPEITMNQLVSKLKENPTVVFAIDRSYGATLAGKPIYNTWYSSFYSKQMAQWATKEDVVRSFNSWSVDFIYWDQKYTFSSTDKTRNLIGEALVEYGKPVMQVGSLVAFSIAKEKNQFSSIFSLSGKKDLTISGTPNFDGSNIILKSGDIVSRPLEIRSFYSFKYSIEYSCQNNDDFFVAQINWDNASPFYKLLRCSNGNNTFSEVGLIPVGAKEATLYLSTRTDTQVSVHNISIGGK